MSDIELPASWRELQRAARDVRLRAWAPYSRFAVGAALLTVSGEVITGCNVENASWGLTICAERSAVCHAVAIGHREFQAICISLTGLAVPCGACRQFLMEFGSELLVLLDDAASAEGTQPEVVRLSELLPRAFRLNSVSTAEPRPGSGPG
ncbi:MAG: cytidine deaminase [Planctomycetota bacterium]